MAKLRIPSLEQHFNRVAGVYRDIRVTDPEPVYKIKQRLRKKNPVGLDLGCGTGRYSELLMRHLRPSLLLGMDANQSMLEKARECLNPRLRNRKFKFLPLISLDRALPLSDSCLDFVATFNAVHHFTVAAFLEEAARVLSSGGWLSIYTRTPQQNRRTIWGRFFPKFSQKENRLLGQSGLRSLINKTPGLRLRTIEKFTFGRQSTLAELQRFAVDSSYSTFSLYRADEFRECLLKFEENLKQKFSDLTDIRYTAENILYLARRD
jgi:ubiquinone/menaquinone biosynthesis C-methylase UbiE